MGAREKLEQHSIFLQKVAYALLTEENVRLGTIGKLVGDAGMFDRDMSTILTILFAHNNLAPSVPDAEKPKTILEQIAKDLTSRGFYLPSFQRRWNHIEKVTNGSFQQPQPNQHGAGEAGALDRPLRRLREKMYEIRLSDEAMRAKPSEGRPSDGPRLGLITTQSVEKLISSVKALETEGLSYNVRDSGERATKRQTEFLNARYDELSAKLNKSVGSTAEGQKIKILHLHPPAWKNEPDRGERWYAVAEDDFARLVEAVGKAVRGGFNPDSRFEYIDELIGEEPVETGTGRREDEWEAERAELAELEQPDPGGNDRAVVRTVHLPFAPDQIDDNFPTLELHKDEYIGQNISRTIVENINRMRFSGFVDFDQNYRMMIMWANAPDDDDAQRDELGTSYRDLLLKVLGHYKSKFGELLDMDPEVHRTNTGAALYFPKPASVAHLVRNFNELRNLINKVNEVIERQETDRGLSRAFNREINDQELPAYMETA